MRVRIDAPTRELNIALGRLAREPAAMRAAFTKTAKEISEPLKRDLQRAVLATSSNGAKHTGLRASTARALTTKVTYRGSRIGVRVEVDKSKMPNGQEKLPGLMNVGKWRHPVKGNRNVWVEQRVTPVRWFDNTIGGKGAAITRKLADAANAVIEELDAPW